MPSSSAMVLRHQGSGYLLVLTITGIDIKKIKCLYCQNDMVEIIQHKTSGFFFSSLSVGFALFFSV